MCIRDRRDGVSREPVRVARSVETLVMSVDDVEREGQRLHPRKELASHDRMLSNLGHLFRSEAGRFEEYGVADRDLADVVEEAAAFHGLELEAREPDLRAETPGVNRDALAVPV